MTNEQRIREKISTIEGLADYLVIYDDYYREYRTSDSEAFTSKKEAVTHEVEWLKEECNGKW